LVLPLESAVIPSGVFYPALLWPVSSDIDFIPRCPKFQKHEYEVVDNHAETKELSSPNAAPVIPL
jgi:hypothetical protein